MTVAESQDSPENGTRHGPPDDAGPAAPDGSPHEPDPAAPDSSPPRDGPAAPDRPPDDAEPAAPGGSGCSCPEPDDDSSEARHRRALVLSEVAAEGPKGLSRVLLRAAADDADAAAVPVSSLVHAVPGVSAPDGHELLARARIHDGALAGDIGPGQRVALVELVTRTAAPPR